MKERILIVEDQFVEADYLQLMLTQAGYGVIGIARSVARAQEIIKDERPGFVLIDIFLKGKQTGIDLAKQLAQENIPFVYLSANSNEEVLTAAKATQPYGFIVKPFREQDLLITLEIARYRHAHSLETQYHKEAELRRGLKNIVTEAVSREEKLLKMAVALQSYIPFDLIAIGFNNIGEADFRGISFLRVGFNEYQTIGAKELATITKSSINELAGLDGAALFKKFTNTFQMQSRLSAPLTLKGERCFSLDLYNRRPDAYHSDHSALFEQIGAELAQNIEDILAEKRLANIATPSAKTNMPKNNYSPKGFEGIVGKSHLLLGVFDLVSQVAFADTSVLLLGESGTGKGKVADCIHVLSPRANKPFIKVNCAALPATLIESELFGHEKGAFTGASDKRIGKFEKASGGTIFLDEVGDMPIELQSKLLRVLQEKEIERLGGANTIKIDVRVIAATNKNLEKEVAEGRFRLDLYYRLNVFPITLPPLRARKEDIPSLAYYFMNYYNNKAGRKIGGLSDEVLKKMMAYHWPGNIRELEHLIERSVLIAKGAVIEDIPLPVVREAVTAPGEEEHRMKTIHENERDYILAVLKKCNGRVWGRGAAAEILNIPPSTLKYKMKKLGIKKEYIH